MNINYIGEHLLSGILGKSFIWGSLMFLVLSAVLYLIAIRKKENGNIYIKLAGNSFIAHFVFLLGACFTLYFLIVNHYYEFSYVWQYSSNDLPFKFLVSSFWAGQEGSFLIWAFFQGIIGLILLRSFKDWKPYGMVVFISGQVFLLCMLLGITIGPLTIGGSPFSLLREMNQYKNDELFRQANYLQMLVDGQGLNPLLENIWMIIHPPALFLGYSVALAPFSYAVASLWRKEYKSWLKPALIWTVASLLTLGIGIILGGRWAYESLTFGGFWAWDPVENASLVPWLFFVAALHLMLISYKQEHGYGLSYFFVILGWVFVVYATYLTRSGVLGETSVHSFGDNEKSLLMIIFNLLFLVVPLVILISKLRKLPNKKKEEHLLSREFWMLIGSIMVAMSAFQVILTTSIPVFNKLFGSSVAPPIDNVGFYNRWQLPFALIVVFITGIAQWMTYEKNKGRELLRRMGLSILISLVLTLFFALVLGMKHMNHIIFMFFVLYLASTSVHFIKVYFTKTKNLGSAITHAGFAIFLLGVILAFSNSKIISHNLTDFDLGSEKENGENLVLMRGQAEPMGDYDATYSNSTAKGRETFYQVDFKKKKDSANGKVAFTLYPSVNHNDRMGNVYNPDTRHMLFKDIFTYISFAQNAGQETTPDGFTQTGTKEMKPHDTVNFKQGQVILDSVSHQVQGTDSMSISLTAKFRVMTMNGSSEKAVVSYKMDHETFKHEDALIQSGRLKLRFEGISPTSNGIVVGLYEKTKDFIVIKSMIFPMMNVLWLGVIIMFSGLTYTLWRKLRNKRKGGKAFEDIDESSVV